MVSKIEKDRMDNMIFEGKLAICPNCGYIVYPKFIKYHNGDSNLRWCNHCYHGEARIFWRYIY